MSDISWYSKRGRYHQSTQDNLELHTHPASTLSPALADEDRSEDRCEHDAAPADREAPRLGHADWHNLQLP